MVAVAAYYGLITLWIWENIRAKDKTFTYDSHRQNLVFSFPITFFAFSVRYVAKIFKFNHFSWYYLALLKTSNYLLLLSMCIPELFLRTVDHESTSKCMFNMFSIERFNICLVADIYFNPQIIKTIRGTWRFMGL
jgi:hypothetical protein